MIVSDRWYDPTMLQIIAIGFFMWVVGINPFKVIAKFAKFAFHMYCLCFTLPFYGLLIWWYCW